MVCLTITPSRLRMKFSVSRLFKILPKNEESDPMIRKLLIASATAACLCVMVAPVSAQFGQGNSSNNLFSQYSTQGAGTNTAGIYPAPYDSPRLGAQSYYTYQPLMPHEMMYCLLYTSPSPRDGLLSRMPSSA